MENLKTQTSKKYFSSLAIIHIALTLSPFFLLGFLMFFTISEPLSPEDVETDSFDIFQYIVPLIILINIILNFTFIQNKIGECRKKTDIISKMNSYRTILIMRYAMLEGPALFSFVVYFLTQNMMYIYIGIIPFIFLVMWRPTRDTAIKDLQLNGDEIELIRNPEAIIAEVIDQNTNK